MKSSLIKLAVLAAMAVGTSGAAMAQVCPAGYAWNGAVCAPMGPGPAPYAYAPNNPVSGAAAGAATGAAAGGAAAGPVGAVVGGALGTAAGTVAGTANMVTGAPVATTGSALPPRHDPRCPVGWQFWEGGCYPR